MKRITVNYWIEDHKYCWSMNGKTYTEYDENTMHTAIIAAGYYPYIEIRRKNGGRNKKFLFSDLSGRGYNEVVNFDHIINLPPSLCTTEEEAEELTEYLMSAEIAEEFLSNSFKITCL